MKKILKKIKSNKILSALSFLIVALFIILVVRITYAYLAADVQDGLRDANIISDTVDTLKFIEGDPLNINATSTTLPENGTNLVTVSRPKASLLANDTNNQATYSYYVYFELSNNTFVYSNGTTPEILLTITDPNNQLVEKSIEGLKYVTVNGVKGYDVTTYNGTFEVGAMEIASSDSVTPTIQEWTFTLTYLNQNFDQSINYGNSLSTKILMQTEQYYEVMINYAFVDGEEDSTVSLPNTYYVLLKDGENYDIVPASINGYAPLVTKVSGTIAASDVSTTVYYGKDVVGVNSDPNISDGIYDGYQVLISFCAVNGIVDRELTYVTLYKDGVPSVDGVGYLGYAATATPNAGYDPISLAWVPEDPYIGMEIIEPTTFTAAFTAIPGGDALIPSIP